jgi:hypothetical protein
MVLPYVALPELAKSDVGTRREIMREILLSPLLRTAPPQGIPSAWDVWFGLATWHDYRNPLFVSDEAEVVFLAASALQASNDRPLFVHGDFLSKNVLYDGNRWLLTDPICGIGELAYDLAKLSTEISDDTYTESLLEDLSGEVERGRLEAWRGCISFGERSWDEIENPNSLSGPEGYKSIFEENYDLLLSHARYATDEDHAKWHTYKEAFLQRAEK